jgi:hypothetical protein
MADGQSPPTGAIRDHQKRRKQRQSLGSVVVRNSRPVVAPAKERNQIAVCAYGN